MAIARGDKMVMVDMHHFEEAIEEWADKNKELQQADPVAASAPQAQSPQNPYEQLAEKLKSWALSETTKETLAGGIGTINFNELAKMLDILGFSAEQMFLTIRER